MDGVVNRYLNVNVNYSYQADPDIEGFDPTETNFPANNRFNVGFNFNYGRLLGNFMVSYTGDALLAGRARPTIRRLDGRVHARESWLWCEVDAGPPGHQPQDHQSRRTARSSSTSSATS